MKTFLLIAFLFSHDIMLTWTNPPDADLHAIRIMCSIQGVTLFTFPDLIRENGLHNPSMPDSTRVSLPCFSIQRLCTFWAQAVDTAGNVSPNSNSAQINTKP